MGRICWMFKTGTIHVKFVNYQKFNVLTLVNHLIWGFTSNIAAADTLFLLCGRWTSYTPINWYAVFVSVITRIPCSFWDIIHMIYVTGPAKSTMWVQKDHQFFHNLITIYTYTTTSSPLLQNLMSFLLYYTQNYKILTKM